MAATMAFLLSIFMLGLRTKSAAGALVLEPRFTLVAGITVLVFSGRLLLHLFWWNKKALSSHSFKQPGWFEQLASSKKIGWFGQLALAQKLKGLGKHGGTIMIALCFILPLLLFFFNLKLGTGLPLRYWFDIATLILTYIMLGWGLNIVVGLAGLLDLGYVAFYAIGAYSYALLAQHFGLSFWLCLPLAGLLAATWGVILGFPVLRLRGDYLAIVTLAFGEIIRIILLNWYQFTGGPDGLSGVPRPSFFGLPFKRYGDQTFHIFFGLDYSSLHRILFLYYIILLLALLTNFVTHKMRRLPIGRAWEALREDETACRSLGINTVNTKLTAFATGAMFGGFAGSFFATRQGFISPESFTFIESAIILAIVVLGGMGSQIGVVIASVVMIGGFELLRNMEGLKYVFGQEFDPSLYRMILFGFAMVAIMVWKPRGLISARLPTIFLKTETAVSPSPQNKGDAQ
ncbi:MAG: high-affinity branched-chain amino acid ABC transporter permease LivM [Hyphomicrobiaceae bacterium]|nr:high-affinity branched-chain amino acid ABC transporter permease LivM [Hyphomicrobiaceae bacterium]